MQLNLTPDCNRTTITLLGNTGIMTLSPPLGRGDSVILFLSLKVGVCNGRTLALDKNSATEC